MTSISELARSFRSMMGNESEARAAETLPLEIPSIGVESIRADEYLTVSNVPSIDYSTMWGSSVTFVTATEPPRDVVVPPQPEANEVAPTLEDGEAAAYRRTCKAIGYEPAALVEQELLAFMREKKIRRYDNTKVGEYLSAKAKKALGHYGTWQWRALRAQDEGEETGRSTDRFGDETTASKPYQQAIPLRVLARVEQFVQKFGNKVRFLVSDYAEKKPDPFIAVVPKQGGVDPIVFDVWDEPDFK